MHEMSIAVQIVEQAVAICQQNGATHVEQIVIEVGRLRQVVPDALELAFAAASEGTPAQGARLQIIDTRIVAVCRQCECMYLPAIDNFTCPQCQAADARIVAGNDIILRSLACCVPDEEVVTTHADSGHRERAEGQRGGGRDQPPAS